MSSIRSLMMMLVSLPPNSTITDFSRSCVSGRCAVAPWSSRAIEYASGFAIQMNRYRSLFGSLSITTLWFDSTLMRTLSTVISTMRRSLLRWVWADVDWRELVSLGLPHCTTNPRQAQIWRGQPFERAMLQLAWTKRCIIKSNVREADYARRNCRSIRHTFDASSEWDRT